MYLAHLFVRLIHVIRYRLPSKVYRDRMLPCRDVYRRRGRGEERLVFRKVCQSERSRHDHYPERLDGTFRLGPPLPLAQTRNARENTNEDVGVDAPLVRFVHDDDRVAGEQEIGGKFPQKNTVRHKLDGGVGRGGGGVSDLVRYNARPSGKVELGFDARGE